MKSIWKLLSSSFYEWRRGKGKGGEMRRGSESEEEKDSWPPGTEVSSTAITCRALSHHKGMAGNIYYVQGHVAGP